MTSRSGVLEPGGATPQPTRRAWLAAAGGTLLAACGGGGGSDGAPGGPQISAFGADRGTAFVGERVQLVARFSGGSGRIEPGIGAVTSGQPVDTPPLAGRSTFRLVVDDGRVQASRELTVAVGYRNRYRALAQPLISARHATVPLADGSLLLVGGSRGEFSLAETILRYDPARETFNVIGALGAGRESHSATLLADGRVLVAGGLVSLNGWRHSELIDPQRGSVTPTGALVTQRLGHSATRLADGRVLLAGGWGPGGAPYGLLASAEIWDPASGLSRAIAPMATPRGGHSATLLADGSVLIAGGYTGAALAAERFDPLREAFVPVAGAAVPLAMHAAHRMADGSVLLLGGETGLAAQPVPTVLRYDPLQRALAEARPLAAPRSLVSSVLTAGDEVLLFGGNDAEHPATAAAEAYRSDRGGIALAALPRRRAWHSTTLLRDGRVLIVGGEDEHGGYVAQALVYE